MDRPWYVFRYYLEYSLGKARVEIVTSAAVGVAHHQQFSYNSVIKFGSVNTINVDSIRIRCASGECELNSHSNRIQCEKAFNSCPLVCMCYTRYKGVFIALKLLGASLS